MWTGKPTYMGNNLYSVTFTNMAGSKYPLYFDMSYNGNTALTHEFFVPVTPIFVVVSALTADAGKNYQFVIKASSEIDVDSGILISCYTDVSWAIDTQLKAETKITVPTDRLIGYTCPMPSTAGRHYAYIKYDCGLVCSRWSSQRVVTSPDFKEVAPVSRLPYNMPITYVFTAVRTITSAISVAMISRGSYTSKVITGTALSGVTAGSQYNVTFSARTDSGKTYSLRLKFNCNDGSECDEWVSAALPVAFDASFSLVTPDSTVALSAGTKPTFTFKSKLTKAISGSATLYRFTPGIFEASISSASISIGSGATFSFTSGVAVTKSIFPYYVQIDYDCSLSLFGWTGLCSSWTSPYFSVPQDHSNMAFNANANKDGAKETCSVNVTCASVDCKASNITQMQNISCYISRPTPSSRAATATLMVAPARRPLLLRLCLHMTRCRRAFPPAPLSPA